MYCVFMYKYGTKLCPENVDGMAWHAVHRKILAIEIEAEIHLEPG